MLRRSAASLLLLVTVVAGSAATAAAQSTPLQFRTTSERARLELSLDMGYGFGTEGDYIEMATDFRAYAPCGVGFVLRAGIASQGISNAMAFDLGVAQRVDLVGGTHGGLQLALAAGASVAYGPFDPAGDVGAPGAFGMIHLDVWTTNFFIGVGVTGHALIPGRFDQGGREEPILTVSPMLHFGGDWGL